MGPSASTIIAAESFSDVWFILSACYMQLPFLKWSLNAATLLAPKHVIEFKEMRAVIGTYIHIFMCVRTRARVRVILDVVVSSLGNST